MKISYILEKGTGDLNEDALLANNSVFAVFDGATSLEKKNFNNGLTGGFIASNTAKKKFDNKEKSLPQLAFDANLAIRDKMINNNVNISDKISLWSTSAAAIKFNQDIIEWAQIGDATIIFIHEDGSFSLPSEKLNHDKKTLYMWKHIANKTNLPIHEALKGQIKKVRKRMNIDYGVLNGESSFVSFLNSGKEKIENKKEIILFTDGLSIPSMEPGNDNFDKFISIYKQKGLDGLKTEIRASEKKDPECKIYPRFKTHDDIAAISISL